MKALETPIRNLFTPTIAALLLFAGGFALKDAYALEPASAMTALKTRIETPEFEECVEFYKALLGMQVVESWDEEGDRGAILGLSDDSNGEAFLELAHSNVAGSRDGISLQFRVHDIHAIAATLRGRWEFRGPTERPWGSTYVYLLDPAGTQVILYQGNL